MAGHLLSVFSVIALRMRLMRGRKAAARRRRQRARALLWLAGLLMVSPPAVAQAPSDSPEAPAGDVEDYQDLWDRGDYSGALRQLNEMIMTLSRGVPPRYLYDRAELHFTTGRLKLAVQDMEILCRQIAAPIYTLRLAEYYRYLGKQELYERTLEDAARQAENRWFYGAYEENVVAMARIKDHQGENPRTILRTLLDPLIERRPDFPGGTNAAGSLALSKDDYGLAEEYFTQTLERDPGNQVALAGLVRSYLASSDPRYQDALETLRGLNPNHATVIEVDAELLIRSGDYGEALERIDEGLQINAYHSRLQALNASALFFLDRPEAMETVQREALSVNARNSEIFRIPGEMASNRLRINEAVEFLEQALVVDPEDVEAQALLGFALLDLGKDLEAKQRLEAAFDADPYDVRVYNTLKVLDTLGHFATLDRGDFRLSLPPDEAGLLADDAFDLLEDGREILGAKYEVEFETPVVVQMFDRHDDFIVRSMGFPGAVGYLGLCTGQLITMGSPSARPPGQVNWRLVLWHEFAHIVTLQKTRNRMPRWLSEGISSFEERQRDPAWGERAAVEYKQVYTREGIPRMHHLERYFTTPKTNLHLSYGYFASAEFVDYYTSAWSFAALNRALDLIGEGAATETALASAAGRSRREINDGFAEHLRHRLRKFENLPDIQEAQSRSVSVMDEGTSVTLGNQNWAGGSSPFTEAMESGMQALREKRWSDAEMHLKRAHELYPEYQGADAPLRLLIDLYDRLGRREDLRRALEEQIASSATDLASYARYARLLRAEADWKGVAKISEKAFGIDPFDPFMRKARVEAAVELGQTDIALRQLDHLVELDASRAADYHLRRVELLMKADRWGQAHDEVFALLERLPYFWEAQQALLAIVERESAMGDAAHSRGVDVYASPSAAGP